ncbi:hypothetical protein [Luteolibacter sp. Populi]|uniref:hypothetical protein n=1 Tax=Luteolibacter sp. Populi TaxID=3230487 RepID=UPI0034668EF9
MSGTIGTVEKTAGKRMGLYSGLIFGAWMTVFYAFRSTPWYTAFLPGILAGVVFGVFVGWLGRRKAKTLTITRPNLGNEALIFEGPANRLEGAKGAGGYLFLTSSRLLFVSPGESPQGENVEIRLAEIGDVEATQTLGLISNGLLLSLHSGKSERFVVSNHETWCEKIRLAIAGATRAAV